jgi:C4-dicarboxylate-specific signal transduction histidine kinase
MGSNTTDDATPAAGRPSRAGAEAARYGILRRLAPALKHDMVVNLQAIAMMAEVMNARLERGAPAPGDFHASISKLNRLARDAVANCLKVASWLDPSEDEGVRIAQGVEDCLQLLASNFNFRGFLVTRELTDSPFQVSRVVLRHLLVASLITLTDAMDGPCQVHVTAEVVAGLAQITVQVSPRQDNYEGLPFEANYRQLEWPDVQALALAESVQLVRGAGNIVMHIPRAIPTAPLQIAPV